MHSPFVGVPSFRGSLELNPLVLWSRPRSKWHLWWMLEERWYRMRHGERCTLCIISCAMIQYQHLLKGCQLKPWGMVNWHPLGTSFTIFWKVRVYICYTGIYVYMLYSTHHDNDTSFGSLFCFVCLSISMFKTTDWANPSQEVEDPKSFLARGQSCKRKPGEKMWKLGEWIGIHSQLWIPF